MQKHLIIMSLSLATTPACSENNLQYLSGSVSQRSSAAQIPRKLHKNSSAAQRARVLHKYLESCTRARALLSNSLRTRDCWPRKRKILKSADGIHARQRSDGTMERFGARITGRLFFKCHIYPGKNQLRQNATFNCDITKKPFRLNKLQCLRIVCL